MRVSYVVATYRRLATLRETLDSLAAVTPPAGGVEVVVVDDGAQDAVREHVGGRPGVVYVPGAGRGAAAARNAGAAAAGGDMLLFCDDDMVLAPQHALRHVELHERHGHCLSNGVRDFSPSSLEQMSATPFGRWRVALDRRFQAEAMRGEPMGEGAVRTATVTASDLGVMRTEFAQLGGFDESFPSAGAEDQDLSLRATQAGLTLIRSSAIVAQHNESYVALAAFCDREQRGAATFAVLARKHPAEFAWWPYVLENAPRRRDDPPARRARKLAKRIGSRRPGLRAGHAMVSAAERARVPDRLLGRAYSALVGLHMYRGFIDATRPDDPWAARTP